MNTRFFALFLTALILMTESPAFAAARVGAPPSQVQIVKRQKATLKAASQAVLRLSRSHTRPVVKLNNDSLHRGFLTIKSSKVPKAKIPAT
jgi:hypothetical protein